MSSWESSGVLKRMFVFKHVVYQLWLKHFPIFCCLLHSSVCIFSSFQYFHPEHIKNSWMETGWTKIWWHAEIAWFMNAHKSAVRNLPRPHTSNSNNCLQKSQFPFPTLISAIWSLILWNNLVCLSFEIWLALYILLAPSMSAFPVEKLAPFTPYHNNTIEGGTWNVYCSGILFYSFSKKKKSPRNEPSYW